MATYKDPHTQEFEDKLDAYGYQTEDDIEAADLEDFESDDLEDVAPSDHSYLKGMWGDFRTKQKELAEDTVHAHGMVQSFVNAFARDGKYIVVFDKNTSTAGTDMKAKFVTITPSPIADKNLTAEEAGLILTGLAVHEISHPRYGRRTWEAVEKVFPMNATASRISNLLDDIRIERRFVADYPGYAGIFDPTLEYIGQAGQTPGVLRKQSLDAPVNLAIAATRYAKFSDWSDPAIMREFNWWNDWANRGAREDAPKRHVDFIREALQHIVAQKAAQAKKAAQQKAPHPPVITGPEGEPSDDIPNDTNDGEEGEDIGSGQKGMADAEKPDTQEAGDATPIKPAANDDGTTAESASGGDLSDDELNDATKPTNSRDRMSEDEVDPTSSCSGSVAIDKAAVEGDVDPRELKKLKDEADAIIESHRNQETDGHGGTVDVNRSLRGITGGLPRATPSSVAAKYIRNAIMQSRTGHTDHSPFKRHGRLDQRGIARIANQDYRLFEKRSAPSVGRYNIWVMVDASDSMTWGGYDDQGAPLQKAAAVAHAMAVASTTIPTVKMSLWAWTDPFRGGSYVDAGAALAWRTGMDTDQALRLSTVKTGGTPDAVVMGWAARAIKKETVGEEIPVIIFASDGAGYGEMNERIKEARAMGIQVYGVSFASGMDEVDERRFGKNNYVKWMGSIEATARPLAKLFARITGGQR